MAWTLTHAKVEWLDRHADELVPCRSETEFARIRLHYSEDGRVRSIERHYTKKGA